VDARDRWSAAGPLVAVSLGCIGIGLYLRWSSTAGPVAALPIWALFLGLGMVASVGAGWAFLVTEDDPGQVEVLRRPVSTVLPPPSRRPASVPTHDALPAAPRPMPAPRPAVIEEPRPTGTDEEVPGPPIRPSVPAGSVPSAEMIEEIDRLMGELRAAKPRSRSSSGP